MTVGIITRHKRFAVRHPVQLRSLRGPALAALLIEVSLYGCRVSASGDTEFSANQPITVEIAGFGDLDGQILSASEKVLSIRFVRPIQGSALHELVGSTPEEPQPILQLPAFGVWSQA